MLYEIKEYEQAEKHYAQRLSAFLYDLSKIRIHMERGEVTAERMFSRSNMKKLIDHYPTKDRFIALVEEDDSLIKTSQDIQSAKSNWEWMMANRSLARRRDCRLKGWRLQISANRKRISLKDTETGEVLLEGTKITVESYLDGYFDGLEQTLGTRVPKQKNELTQFRSYVSVMIAFIV